MTPQRPTCSSTSTTLAHRLLALLLAVAAAAAQSAGQSRLFSIERDSVPLLRGFAVSIDLAGPAQLALGDHGEIEGALRLNLHDQYFPIVEIGYGKADHSDDVVTGISYTTSAPYARIGCDLNLLKNKHSKNRLYGGLRYAFTSYKVSIAQPAFQDPVWGWSAPVGVDGERCSQHWLEAVVGIDAAIAGPLHLGWSVRYKRRIAHSDTAAGQSWYVPGYGRQGDTRLGATFNVIIDI